MPIQDPAIKPKPALWKLVFNLVYSAMGAIKATMGFSKNSGPDIKK